MMAAVVFLVAVTARLVHLQAVRGTPFFDVLMGDARGYDAWAQRLAAGNWVGTDVFYQAPLYPYFLGVLYASIGRDLFLVRVVQACLGGLAAVLIADATARLVSRRAGWIAGLGLALYAPAIFFDTLLQKTVLDVLFICVLVWVASRLLTGRTGPAWWMALGATLGALGLTRENALVLAVVALIWAGATRNHEDTKGHEGRHEASRPKDLKTLRPRVLRASFVPSRLRGVLWLLFGFGVVLAPVVARNYAVTGGFYLTTSQFGPNFYIGNNPTADGTYMALRPGRGSPEFERQDATELAERARGRTLTPAEVSAYWTERAMAFITGDPPRWLALMARKAALLWNAREMLDTESQESYEDVSPLLRVLALVGHFGLLVPLASVGFVALWPERRRVWPLLVMGAAYAASVVAFYVFARYRFPLVPFLMLLAAAGLASLPGLVRSATPRARVWLAAALAAIVALVWLPLLSPARMRAITETNLGTALYETNRLDEAVARYERAIALQPDYAPAFNNLGVALRAQGRLDAAVAAYERGLQLGDDYPDMHYNLANALLAQNRAEEAAFHLRSSLAGEPDSAANHNNLGTALAAKGQYLEAVREFQAAVALDPASALAHRNLGNALASLGRTGDALAALGRAVELAPADAEANYDLGSLLLEGGRPVDAAARFRIALAANPQSPETLNNLGIALASQGQLRQAIPLWEQALAIRPGFADAERNLVTAREALKISR